MEKNLVKVVSPIQISFEKGTQVKFYKNADNLYICIIYGIERGIISNLITDNENVQLPNYFTGLIINSEKNSKTFLCEIEIA